jgi:hypothetical protein
MESSDKGLFRKETKMEREIAMRFIEEVEKTGKSRVKIYDTDFMCDIIDGLESRDIKYTNGILESKIADTEAYFIELAEKKGWSIDYSMNGIIVKKGGKQ